MEGFKEGRSGSGATTLLWQCVLHYLCTASSFSRNRSVTVSLNPTHSEHAELQPSISQTSALELKRWLMDRKPGWLVWSQEEGHRVDLDGHPQGMLLYSCAADREKAVWSNLATVLMEKAVWCNWA